MEENGVIKIFNETEMYIIQSCIFDLEKKISFISHAFNAECELYKSYFQFWMWTIEIKISMVNITDKSHALDAVNAFESVCDLYTMTDWTC